MTRRLHRQPICVASALVVPFLALASPPWLAIDGVGPAWAVLWLLPWALVDGPVSGALAGVALGLVLDGLNLGGLSQVPALLLLGWWWGTAGAACSTDPTQPESGLVGLAWVRGAWFVVDPAALVASRRSLGSPHPELGSADPVVSGPDHGFAGAGVGVVAVAALAQEGSLMRLNRRDLLLGAAAFGLAACGPKEPTEQGIGVVDPAIGAQVQPLFRGCSGGMEPPPSDAHLCAGRICPGGPWNASCWRRCLRARPRMW